MACRKAVLSVLPVTRQGHQVSRTFSSSAIHLDEGRTTTTETSGSRPPRTARFLLEATERQQQRRGSGRFGASRKGSEERSGSDRSGEGNDRRRSAPPGPRFQAPPSIPYDTTKALEFMDDHDWEVTSVLKSRPVYANVAAGRGTVAPLGTVAVNGSRYNPILPSTVFGAHLTGVQSDGQLDPEVEQSLIQDLSTISSSDDKDHRKKSDVPSAENHHYLFRMSHSYQEIMNPRNAINRFNNGSVKHVSGVKYAAESDEAQVDDDQQAERSWKRLERLGGDYSRVSNPLSLLPADNGSTNRKAVLENVSQLLSQNQSIGLQDKKKMLKAVEKGLGSY